MLLTLSKISVECYMKENLTILNVLCTFNGPGHYIYLPL